ncbi:membrane dipeptidase [Branchiibius hedensis]|uniref:Membrane dipeptidase n=1 Tax=Branchiibius hedensis TaxID=672460 RepID=A0A2Y8ZUD6_9MICO|nr:dipeptidase [Branchiibius hedensis]PWJ24650.1 membrane dipeptidase [Branchiibius hedensis]SSA33467.1 membrane dipeptidase [Branchiibius hedensis]
MSDASSLLIIDGHNDLLWEARDQVGYDFERLDVGGDTTGRTHTDIPRLRAGGVGGQFWSVYVPSNLPGATAVTATLEQIDAAHQLIARYDDLQLALSAEQVRTAMADGRIASLLGAEGGQSIDSSLAALRMLYVLGVRYMTLTHNDNTPWAGSATDVELPGGLTSFGVEVVREMNRIGMLVDLSHVAPNTMHAALDATRAPVIFSHSSARTVCDHVRNVPDDVLQRVPGNGGVVMATFVPAFISPAVMAYRQARQDAAAAAGIDSHDAAAVAAFQAEWDQTRSAPHATIDDVVAHLQHLREVAGVDHVGVGGDYDGVDHLPDGLEDVSGYPRLLAALREKSWSEADLAKLANGNLLRVLGDAETVATELQGNEPPSLLRYQST